MEKKKKKQKCRLKTGNGVITALTAGSKMLPTICIDQSSTGSTVQRCMERMIAVALTSTASLVLGKVLEIMMDSVLQRKKKGWHTSKDLMSPGAASIDLSWNQAPLLLEQRRKGEEFNHRKRLSWADRENQMPPYLFIRSGSPLREKEGRGNKACMQHLLSLLRCCK